MLKYLIFLCIISPVICHNSCKPKHVHLSLTGNNNQMRVTWETKSNNCPSDVYYKKFDEENFKKVSGFVKSYSSDEYCTKPAKSQKHELNVHSVVIENLEPDTKYTYYMDESEEFGECHTFRSPHKNSEKFDFFALGDMGESESKNSKCEGAEYVVDSIKRMSTDDTGFVMHIGDISYAFGDSEIWDYFMESIEKVAKHYPWMVGNGNHEYGLDRRFIDPWGVTMFQPPWGNYNSGHHDGGDSGGECGLGMFWRFPTLNNYESTERRYQHPEKLEMFPPFWYSYNYHLVHIVVISTEHDYTEGSLQREWLENNLKNVNRCETPYVIIFGHRPFYNPRKYTGELITGEKLRYNLEKLFIDNSVDMYVSGHIHTYYRSCYLNDWECVDSDKGLVNLIMGSGGRHIDGLKQEDLDFRIVSLVDDWGYGKFSVSRESLVFEFIRAKNDEVLDTFSFKNKFIC